MVDKLIVELQKLEEYSGVTVKALYDMLEKQANVHLVYNILGIVGCVTLTCLGILASVYFIKKGEETNLGWHCITSIYEVMKEISLTATLGISTISLLVIPSCIGDIIQILVNKQAWILEYVTKLIK